MSKNNLDLKNIKSIYLITELKSRGYFTELLYGISDVEMQLDNINECRYSAESKIILTDDDKMDILDNCFNTDYYTERLNEELEEYILDNYDNL